MFKCSPPAEVRAQLRSQSHYLHRDDRLQYNYREHQLQLPGWEENQSWRKAQNPPKRNKLLNKVV